MDPTTWIVAVPLALVTPGLVRTDLRERRLPNRLTAWAATGLVVAWAVGLATGDAVDVVRSALTALVVGVVLVAAAVVGGLGLGDAKLGVVVGGASALVDPRGAGLWVVGTAVAGGATGVVVAVRRRRHARAPADGRATAAPVAVPYGPALLLGWWLVLVLVLVHVAGTAGGATTVVPVVAPP